MPIGRFRDVPAEMDDLERRVVAAQYPEGGLVLGTCVGLILAVVTVDALIVVTPVVGSVVGYWCGLRYRRHRIEGLRAEREEPRGQPAERDETTGQPVERDETTGQPAEREEKRGHPAERDEAE